VDQQNHSASFSYIDGKLVINEDTQAITNSTLSESLSYLEKFTGFSGELAVPEGKGSLDRFVIAKRMLAAGDQAVATNETVGFAFSILDAVKTPGYTQWQIVYDLASQEIHFRTAKNHRHRRIRLTAFNFSCTERVLGFPIDSQDEGDVTDNFSQLTDYQNAQMVARAAYPILSSIPEGITKKFTGYPASTYCENRLGQRTDPAKEHL
jgi:penicillin V acylase-like amidase (Ntn superfamily)